MNHPLTDEMILDMLSSIYRWKPEHRDNADVALLVACAKPYSTEMRAAYDKGFEDALEVIHHMGLVPYSSLIEAKENYYNQEDNQ